LHPFNEENASLSPAALLSDATSILIMASASDSETRDNARYKSLPVTLAVVFSLGLHICLLLISITEPVPAPAPRLISVSINSDPGPPPPDVSPLRGQTKPVTPPDLPADEDTEPEVIVDAASSDESSPETEPDRPLDSDSDAITEPAPEPMMTTRILSSVRKTLGKPSIPEAPDATAPSSIPDLPDAPGWIDQFVGEVDGEIEQWRNPDGSTESRIVTANGQIICGRIHAPSTSDVFNPQFATNVMLFRACGKERPQAPDRNDPRVRTPRTTP